MPQDERQPVSAGRGARDGRFRPRHQGRHRHRRDAVATLPRRRRHPGRTHRRARAAEDDRCRAGARRRRNDRRARLHRPPHALRCAALLGSLPHAVGLARGHLGGHRQLRLRLRADAPRDARARHADHDARRGDPPRVDAAGTSLGLGHVSRIPRQRRTAAEGAERAALRPGGAAPRLGPRLRARQGRRDTDRGRAPRAPPAPARGDGRRGLWMVGAAAPPRRPGRRAARLRRRTDGHRHHARRDRAPARGSACRTQPRLHADGAGDRRRRTRLRAHRAARRGERPPDPLQRRPVVRPVPGGAPGADQLARLLPAARRPGLRPGRHHDRRLHLHVRGLEPLR